MTNPVRIDPFETGPSIHNLRAAIRSNRIAFPAPVPVFPSQHRADIQWRLVELYFVFGWSAARIGERYGVTPRRVRQALHGWVKRATLLGYLQELPVDDQPATETLNRRAAIWISSGADNHVPRA